MERETADWRDVLYRKTFDDETRGLARRVLSDKNCRAEDIEGMLRRFYELEGADWLGRGEVQNIALSATIAAYECFVKNLSADRGLN
ncbi:MAG: hypothetical protein LBH50_05885 [Spirochaetaceae bacterium]|jgi:hypothetical protein|nr:hypothetical protein [Spirochaetaceae bacterium]